MVVTHTNDSTYWKPLKPRVRIYDLIDHNYTNPIYSYDPFNDFGTSNKPISLHFDGSTTNAGTFSVEIEDSDLDLDPDVYLKGNRVIIDGSKDGITYQPAFRGVVRSSSQKIFGINGRNVIISGYSLLIRLTERIVSFVKQAAITAGQYDRTDSTMFTNNLVDYIINTSANYLSLSSFGTEPGLPTEFIHANNLLSSPLDEWVPRVDAAFVPLSSAIQSVLEFSNGLLMYDPSNSELILYNQDQITPAVGTYLLTNQMNQLADDADITMYPVDEYQYHIDYDYPDSASSINCSIGASGCLPGTETTPDSLFDPHTNTDWIYNTGDYGFAIPFIASNTVIQRLRLALECQGNVSSHNSTIAQIRNDSAGVASTQVGSNILLYAEVAGVPTVGTAFPAASTNTFVVGQEPGVDGPTVTQGNQYWLALNDTSYSSNTVRIGWIQTGLGGNQCFTTNGGTSWTLNPNSGGPWNRYELATAPAISEACGGLPATADAEFVYTIAQDPNMIKKMGLVEKTMSSVPTHVKTKQAVDEYLFKKLYISAKSRFVFDFPSVTVPNKLPRAGDVVAHVDRSVNIGLKTAPIQTGIIMDIAYDFAQDSETGELGLTKMGLSTTGMRRGYY